MAVYIVCIKVELRCPGSDKGFHPHQFVQKRFKGSREFSAYMVYAQRSRTQLLMRTSANPQVHQCFYVDHVVEARYFRMACNLTFSSVEFEIYHMAKPGFHRV
nr:unnamed protein product [Spirometra erinaceieuropaei]